MNSELIFALIILIVIISIWVLHNLATIRVAKRLGVEKPWPVWVPIWGKFYVYAKMANKSGWTILFCLILVGPRSIHLQKS